MERYLAALVLVLVTGACRRPQDDADPVAPDRICEDGRIGRTFGDDQHGCREYLDTCLDGLTEAQRVQWRRAIDSCLHHESSLFRCFADVPWC